MRRHACQCSKRTGFGLRSDPKQENSKSQSSSTPNEQRKYPCDMHVTSPERSSGFMTYGVTINSVPSPPHRDCS